MFITHEADRSAMHALFLGAEQTYWRAAEISLNRPWYLVSISQKEEAEEDLQDQEQPFEIVRTLMLSETQDLVSFLTTKDDPLVTIQAVSAMIPSQVGESDGWKMVTLRAIWQAEERVGNEKTGLKVDVLETTDGWRYPTFPMETPVDKLNDLKLIWKA